MTHNGHPQRHLTMRKHQQLGYLVVLVLVCGSVALAATQWTLQPRESKLTFVGTQAGAEFEGAFERFTAYRRFGAGARMAVSARLMKSAPP